MDPKAIDSFVDTLTDAEVEMLAEKLKEKKEGDQAVPNAAKAQEAPLQNAETDLAKKKDMGMMPAGEEDKMKNNMGMKPGEKDMMKNNQEMDPDMMKKKDMGHYKNNEGMDPDDELKKKEDQVGMAKAKAPSPDKAQEAPLQNAEASYSTHKPVKDSYIQRFDSAVRERSELVQICDTLGYESGSRTNSQLKRGLVKAMNPEVDISNKGREYVDGMFDMMKDRLLSKSRLDSALENMGRNYHDTEYNRNKRTDGMSGDRNNVDAPSQDSYIRKQSNLWTIKDYAEWNDMANKSIANAGH